ncbi:hypothetical protein [Streptomyces sp. 3N207]
MGRGETLLELVHVQPYFGDDFGSTSAVCSHSASEARVSGVSAAIPPPTS